jgi:hypothetical protein
MKKALVVGSVKDLVTQAQREPFIYYNLSLLRKLNLQVKHLRAETFAEIEKACGDNHSDIVFLLPFWNESTQEAERVLKALRQSQPTRKLIFIDPFAQANTNYFNVLPYVDYLLKRQRYKNLKDYQRSFVGGSLLTHTLATKLDLAINEWYVGSQVPQEYQHRIIAGWNLGTAKKFKQRLQLSSLLSFLQPSKKIDVFCRLSLGTTKNEDWYYAYRLFAIEKLKPLEKDYKVVSSGKNENQLVSRFQYQLEIQRSRIVFSPFGWGECCWRDFEAVYNNCLLVKPSMEHIETKPNIFIAGETYVPINWDFSDLAEKCHYYLQHPDEAERIIKNARRAYLNYFKNQEFVETIAKIIA